MDSTELCAVVGFGLSRRWEIRKMDDGNLIAMVYDNKLPHKLFETFVMYETH